MDTAVKEHLNSLKAIIAGNWKFKNNPFGGWGGATPTAYRSSQARGRTGAAASGLHHSSWQHRLLNPLSKAKD